MFTNKYYYSFKFFPASIIEKIDHLRVNNLKLKLSTFLDIPNFVYPGWLNNITRVKKPFALFVKVNPIKKDKVLRNLELKKKNLLSNIFYEKRKNSYNSTTSETLSETEAFKVAISKGREKAYKTSFNLITNSINSSKIQNHLDNFDINSRVKYLGQSNLLKNFLRNDLVNPKIYDLTTLSNGFCFNLETVNHKTGVVYGRNLLNNSLILLDRYKLNNHNGIILGSSGSGKSFATKLEILRLYSRNVRVFVIDPEGEYTKLCENLNGQLVNITENSSLLFGDLYSNIQSSKTSIYKIISTFVSLNELESVILNDEIEVSLKGGSFDFVKVYEAVIKRHQDFTYKLHKFVYGEYKNLLKTSSLKASDLTVFNIKEIPDENRDAYMLAITNFLWLQTINNTSKFMLFIDEAWLLLRNNTIAEFINGLTKRIRKYNGGITFISQDVNDFLNSYYGKTILTNCSYKYLLRQDLTEVNLLKKKFSLDENEVEFLLSAYKGFGLIFIDNHRFPHKTINMDFELEYI